MPFPVPLQIPPCDFGKVKGVKIMREMDAILNYKLTYSKILWRRRGLGGGYVPVAVL